MDNFLVLQKTLNQLEVRNLENGDFNKNITIGNAIEYFTISHREDLIAIFTVNKIWHFYRITTAKEIERDKNSSIIIPNRYNFDIIFILNNSLWMIKLNDNKFEFNIFRIIENSLSTSSSSSSSSSLLLSENIIKIVEIIDLKSEENLKITKHFLNNDNLFCIIKNFNNSNNNQWLIELKYDNNNNNNNNNQFNIKNLIKLNNEISTISLIQPSFDNNFVGTLTENNEIVIINKYSKFFKWNSIDKNKDKIRSICFDPNFLNIICIESHKWLYYFYYILNDNNFIQICKISTKFSSSSLSSSLSISSSISLSVSSSEYVIVAIRIPKLYLLNNNSSFIKCETYNNELKYLKDNQTIIDELFSLKYSDFIRKLHQNNMISINNNNNNNNSNNNNNNSSNNNNNNNNIIIDKNFLKLLAKRCLKHQDIDGALFCSAKMNDASLIRSIRSKQSKLTSDIIVIVLYLNYNFLDEAEELLLDRIQNSSECKKLLAKLYSLQNRWHDLFALSDAIQLKTHYYIYARKLEENGEIDDAIKYYELSGNQLEVPRMLFESGNILQLEEYSLKERHSSNQLVTWWGQYCESQGDNHRALDAYRKVNDYYNLVRLLCQDQRVNEAIILVNEQLSKNSSFFHLDHRIENLSESANLQHHHYQYSIDQSLKNNDNNHNQNDIDIKNYQQIIPAILYLGKHLESTDPNESIRYYLQCKAIRHAIRVCIIRHLYDQLARIAVDNCSRNDAENILQTHILPNRYELESEDSLVPLFYKCGRKDEAFQCGIVARSWSELRALCDYELSLEPNERVQLKNDIVQSISNALRDDTSLIDIFIDIVILSNPDNFTLILSTVKHYGIVLDDHLMDKLEKIMAGVNTHLTLVETFAELCLEKGNYQLAAKLFNKGGKRLEAMKALILSGNEEKVIQFANIARDKQIYIMAGNFLQTVGYDDRTLVEKFYLKAGANEQLDRFRASSNSYY